MPLNGSFYTAKDDSSEEERIDIKEKESNIGKAECSLDELRNNMAQLLKCYNGMNSLLKSKQIKIEESSLYQRPPQEHSHDAELSELIK